MSFVKKVKKAMDDGYEVYRHAYKKVEKQLDHQEKVLGNFFDINNKRRKQK